MLCPVMLEFAVLGSGSSGNSAVLCLGETRILIDAGLSAKQICLRLESLGIDPDSLSGIVLTHEHGDHARGIDVFCRKRKLPIYATVHTCEMVRDSVKADVIWKQFEAGGNFEIGDIKAESFSVPHDAVDPVGFVFRCGLSSIGVLSDVGHVTRTIIDRLRGVHTLFAEANYDEMMLQNDTIRPWSTKQRISNRHGHLSNDQTAELVKAVASPHLCQVILGHLSGDCNTPELAEKIVSEQLEKSGYRDVSVECAQRKDPLPLRPAARVIRADAPPQEVEKSAEVDYSSTDQPKTVRVQEPVAVSEWKQSEWAF